MTFGKNTIRRAIPLLLSLGAGYAGSALHMWINSSKGTRTIHASRIELTDDSGRTVISLRANRATHTGGDGEAALAFTDPRGFRRIELGMSGGNNTPFLRFYGSDSRQRIGLLLGYDDDPALQLCDSNRIRAVLGATHGDAPSSAEDQWGLSFRAQKEGAGASIGFNRWWDMSYQAGVTLTDGSGRTWKAVAGSDLKPNPLIRRRSK
jgi:hypothetical protein